MIEVKNVTKTYFINRKTKCTAIDDVSLVLPDSGMVFIIGKSGSGKSTLLNLIGGLDNTTSGTILADGNEITTFDQRLLTKYRSSYIGFIFQDYHVLNSFTVLQNINLALDITNSSDDQKVEEILKVVDLTEYKDRYPSELSGGQKQRIAVARALVKDAPVILCDEPTGNLDSKTSQQILDLLKEISKDKLVVVVSHNMVEANNYADRIIELYDGKVVRDRRRSVNYSNNFKIEDNIIYIPHYRDLTENELELINNEIKNNDDVSFKQIGNKFIDTKISVKEKDKFNVQGSLISRKSSKKLFKSFFKGKGFSMGLSVFLAALLLTCFAIFQSFLNFDGNAELSKSLTKYDIYSVPLQKGNETSEGVSLNKIQVVYDEEVNKFFENGYDGKIYKKYTNTFPITTSQYSVDSKGSYNIINNLNTFYVRETLGVINCDENFLASIYGIDGKVEYIYKADEYKTYGVYITDFIADSMLLYRFNEFDSYESLLGTYTYNKYYQYGYINGIIETGYEERYPTLIEKFNEVFKNPHTTIDTNEILNSEEFAHYLIEAMNYLAFSYSIEDNYVEKLKTNEYRDFYKIGNSKLSTNNSNLISSISFYDDSRIKKDLHDNEMIMAESTFMKLFPQTSVEEFEPFDMALTIYKNFGIEEVQYEKTFNVIGLHKSNNYISVDKNTVLREYDAVAYGIYLDSHNDISEMLLTATENNYIVCCADATKLSTINQVLNIFGKFFLLIEVLFLVLCIVFIVNIGLSSVKKNKYEIGVLKAIGTSSFDIMRIYIRQTIIICLAIVIVSNIGIYLGTYVGNSILVSAFEEILDTTFYDLKLINYIPKIVGQDLIYTVIISFISFIIPQIILFKIKPIDIIRAKE